MLKEWSSDTNAQVHTVDRLHHSVKLKNKKIGSAIENQDGADASFKEINRNLSANIANADLGHKNMTKIESSIASCRRDIDPSVQLVEGLSNRAESIEPPPPT